MGARGIRPFAPKLEGENSGGNRPFPPPQGKKKKVSQKGIGESSPFQAVNGRGGRSGWLRLCLKGKKHVKERKKQPISCLTPGHKRREKRGRGYPAGVDS